MNHEATSLPSLVENLVKNWEIEASFKLELKDWRTIDHSKYTFAINGGPPQSAEHMLKVGTYNAIITEPNEFYSPRTSDFASSHKSFKRMMPTFAWEVLEVYSGPPQVAFRWRHWGDMKSDYVGFNECVVASKPLLRRCVQVADIPISASSKGEKVTIPAHGQTISIQGVTVANLDDKFQVTKLETWFDPLDMFRQIAPKGLGNKEVRGTADMKNRDIVQTASAETLVADLKKESGNAIASEEGSRDAKQAHEEMSMIQPAECPFLNAE